tara:strand:- start:171012 stop:172259 length:1248 start_codon:yes stop_codon:yes gene_type:complete
MLKAVTLIALTGTTLLGFNQAPAAPTQTKSIRSDQQIDPPSFNLISDTEIIADGHTFTSWQDLYESGYYGFEENRCATRPIPHNGFDSQRGGADCSFNNTTIRDIYDPSVVKYRIPVVVHVIQRSNGTGAMTDERVQSQIDILNEDFLAMSGTNGAPGNDGQIEFYLATIDPQGNPTTGITRSTNNTWFNDGGAYYNTLAWDTNRYLNIYTNNGGGALGYVPDLPQGGIAGSNSDRVVILESTFGRNAPFSPFNLGRTVTHEVGHYLGLWHTFDNGCGTTSGCYTSGDRICDTNRESSPTSGCPTSRVSCGTQAPIHNYMDYSDDICMNQFTVEQNNRMRCSLINYRPNLFTEESTGGCNIADLSEVFGRLDNFDVSAFINLFSAQSTDVDFNNDGSWNFFDVSIFLQAYNAGCP